MSLNYIPDCSSPAIYFIPQHAEWGFLSILYEFFIYHGITLRSFNSDKSPHSITEKEKTKCNLILKMKYLKMEDEISQNGHFVSTIIVVRAY